MTTDRGINPDWRRKKGKSFKPSLSSRQRGAKTVFDRAEELGYHSAFPTPAEAQAWIDAHEKENDVKEGAQDKFVRGSNSVYGKMLTVTRSGQSYHIPEMWLIGAERSGMTTRQAIEHWIEQDEMEQQSRTEAALPLKHCVHCGEKNVPFSSTNSVCSDCQKKYRRPTQMKEGKELKIREALGKGVCAKCGTGVQVFKSNESRGVYQRTGLCQSCQEGKVLKEHGYIAYYNSQKKEIQANSSYEAQQKAIELFKPPKSQRHMVHVHLAEKDGKPVTQSTQFVGERHINEASTREAMCRKCKEKTTQVWDDGDWACRKCGAWQQEVPLKTEAEPSQKSPEMEKTLRGMGVNRDAIHRDECSFCGGPAKNFKDALSKKEYSISGMCQDCQDKTFGESKNFVLQSEVRKELMETVRLIKEAGMHPDFEQKAHEWLKAVQVKVNDYYAKHFPGQTPTISFDKGRTYWRAVSNGPTGGNKSAYAFLDVRTGDILKPASWRGPAKIPRGNIFKQGSLGVGAFGADYVRGPSVGKFD